MGSCTSFTRPSRKFCQGSSWILHGLLRAGEHEPRRPGPTTCETGSEFFARVDPVAGGTHRPALQAGASGPAMLVWNKTVEAHWSLAEGKGLYTTAPGACEEVHRHIELLVSAA